VSGEVTLVDTSDGAVARLVQAAAKLFGRPRFERAALVGGLAVTMRIATVHRATNDLDTVLDDDEPSIGLEYLAGTATPDADRIDIDGVKVDVMATSPLPTDARELPDGDLERLFVLGTQSPSTSRPRRRLWPASSTPSTTDAMQGSRSARATRGISFDSSLISYVRLRSCRSSRRRRSTLLRSCRRRHNVG
jgi:hypothetical protein